MRGRYAIAMLVVALASAAIARKSSASRCAASRCASAALVESYVAISMAGTGPDSGTAPGDELEAHAAAPRETAIAMAAMRELRFERFASLFTPRRMLPLRSPGKESRTGSRAQAPRVRSEQTENRGTPVGTEDGTRPA